MNTTTAMTISEAQKKQYRDEGYFVLERVIPDEHLDLLRSEAQNFIDLMNAQMDKAGSDSLGISHRNKRYFIANHHRESARLHEFIFSDLMAEICKATLGDNAYLFWEQYVIKGAEQGMKFAWHQDAAYGEGFKYKPYVTCWCALDDMSLDNGTAYILPFSRAGSRELQKHVQEPGTNDLIGYHGADPGIPVLVPAGSIAVFTSHTFHRSGSNTTSRMRRVYLPQYSSEPMVKEQSEKNGFAIPFIKDGKRVRQGTCP